MAELRRTGKIPESTYFELSSSVALMGVQEFSNRILKIEIKHNAILNIRMK
jgi:hypothetical protein